MLKRASILCIINIDTTVLLTLESSIYKINSHIVRRYIVKVKLKKMTNFETWKMKQYLSTSYKAAMFIYDFVNICFRVIQNSKTRHHLIKVFSLKPFYYYSAVNCQSICKFVFYKTVWKLFVSCAVNICRSPANIIKKKSTVVAFQRLI